MRTSTSTVRIEAPRVVVWAVITEPAYVQQWQYGSALSTDWSIGSPIRFTTEWEGTTFEQWGTVQLVDAPTQLRYTLFAPRPGVEDQPENYFTMIYRLEDDAAGTVLTITQEDPRADAGDDSGSEDSDGDDEENPVLVALKSLAESVETTASD